MLDLPRFRGEARCWVSVTDVAVWASSSLSMQFLGSAPAEPVPSSRPMRRLCRRAQSLSSTRGLRAREGLCLIGASTAA